MPFGKLEAKRNKGTYRRLFEGWFNKTTGADHLCIGFNTNASGTYRCLFLH